MSKLAHSDDEAMEDIERQPVPDESRMQEAKHTPGPWHHSKGTAPHFQGQVSSETTGTTIAITYSDENEANARLIAAAPDMLEALRIIASGGAGQYQWSMTKAETIARAAIAKTTAA